jgi:flavorubredoxin
MSAFSPEPHTGSLPRVLAPDLLWAGSCLSADYNGDVVHGHFCVYLVKGRDKTMLVDTGHPLHWKALEHDVETFLDGRPLDYVFCTHGEFPHAGLLPAWLRKYPNCVGVGKLTDYRYFYPELVHRIRQVDVGDTVDLGDRTVTFVPAVWRDLKDTLWAFEDKYRMLFVADAFAYMHYHRSGQCDYRTSEHPPPDLSAMQFISERALQWTKYKDARTTYADADRLYELLKPAVIAPAHGGFIDQPDELFELAKRGLILGEPAASAPAASGPEGGAR